jgi:hypothetical protein
LKFFKNNGFENSIITNGSATLDFWNSIVDDMDVLCISFHPRYGNYKHISKVVEVFKGKRIILNLLMDKDYWERSIEAAEYFKSKGVKLIYKGILEKLADSAYVDYSKDQLDFLMNHTIKTDSSDDIIVTYSDGQSESFDGQKIISNNLNHLAGYFCDVGKSSLVIKWNGIVTGGQCKEVVFGNLASNKQLRVKLLDQSIICQKPKCNCIYDLKINKQAQ